MEMHQLRYFIQVAKLESVSKAASMLNITQSALSKTIAKLEGELGTPLFDRIGKRLFLNDRGKFFLKAAEKALRDLSEAALAVGHRPNEVEGSVEVGVFGSQSQAIDCLAAFMETYGGIAVTLDARRETTTSDLLRKYDLVFYTQGAAFEAVHGIPYDQTERYLQVPEAHPLAQAREADLSRFRDDWFIFTNTTAGVYEENYRLCTESGFVPKVRAITSSGAAQHAFIREGLGIGFSNVSDIPSAGTGCAYVKLKGEKPAETLCFAARPVHSLSSCGKLLLDFAFDYFGIPQNDQTMGVFEGN